MTNDAPQYIQLQEKLAFLEHTVDSLNHVIIEQGHALDAMQKKLVALEGRIASAGADQGDAPDPLDEKPPHY